MTGSADMTATIVAHRGVCQPALTATHLRRPADQYAAFDHALQILATWAVRAAHRAQHEPPHDPASLDFSAPQSDVSPCLRDRSGSPTTTGGNQ